MLVRSVFAALLLGHALVHAGFLAPRPQATAGGPPWPFELDRSWILETFGIDPAVTRLIGLAAVAAAVAGLAMSALITLGVGPGELWAAAIAVGTVGSLLALLLFFHPWLVVGVGIDVGLLWTVFVLSWSPSNLA
jgi:hypothetical protein